MVAPLLKAVAAGAAKNAGKKAATSKAAKKAARKQMVEDYAKVRKKFQRQLNDTEKKIESGALSDSGLQSAMQFRESLKVSIQDTYAVKSGEKRGEYLTSLDRLQRRANFADEIISSGFNAENGRKNEMFTRDINQASIGGVSTKSKEEVKIFYGATKNVWGGMDITKRHQAIMDYFGVDTLEEAWDIVFSNPDVQKALEKAKKAQQKIESENDITDGSTDVKEVETSPDYIEELITVLDTKRTFQ